MIESDAFEEEEGRPPTIPDGRASHDYNVQATELAQANGAEMQMMMEDLINETDSSEPFIIPSPGSTEIGDETTPLWITIFSSTGLLGCSLLLAITIVFSLFLVLRNRACLDCFLTVFTSFAVLVLLLLVPLVQSSRLAPGELTSNFVDLDRPFMLIIIQGVGALVLYAALSTIISLAIYMMPDIVETQWLMVVRVVASLFSLTAPLIDVLLEWNRQQASAHCVDGLCRWHVLRKDATLTIILLIWCACVLLTVGAANLVEIRKIPAVVNKWKKERKPERPTGPSESELQYKRQVAMENARVREVALRRTSSTPRDKPAATATSDALAPLLSAPPSASPATSTTPASTARKNSSLTPRQPSRRPSNPSNPSPAPHTTRESASPAPSSSDSIPPASVKTHGIQPRNERPRSAGQRRRNNSSGRNSAAPSARAAARRASAANGPDTAEGVQFGAFLTSTQGPYFEQQPSRRDSRAHAQSTGQGHLPVNPPYPQAEEGYYEASSGVDGGRAHNQRVRHDVYPANPPYPQEGYYQEHHRRDGRAMSNSPALTVNPPYPDVGYYEEPGNGDGRSRTGRRGEAGGIGWNM